MVYNLDPSLQMAASQVPYASAQVPQASPQQAQISFQAAPQVVHSSSNEGSSIFNLTNLMLAGATIAAIAGRKTHQAGQVLREASKEGGALAGQTSKISNWQLFSHHLNPRNWFGNTAVAEGLAKGGYSEIGESGSRLFRSPEGDVILLNGRKPLKVTTGEEIALSSESTAAKTSAPAASQATPTTEAGEPAGPFKLCDPAVEQKEFEQKRTAIIPSPIKSVGDSSVPAA